MCVWRPEAIFKKQARKVFNRVGKSPTCWTRLFFSEFSSLRNRCAVHSLHLHNNNSRQDNRQ